MPTLQIPSSFHIIRYGSDLLQNNWSIVRDGFADVLANTFDVTMPYPHLRVLWKYDSFSRTFQVKTSVRFIIVSSFAKTVTGWFDSFREHLADQFINRFNLQCRYFTSIKDNIDIIQYITGASHLRCCFDLVPCYGGLLHNDYDSVTNFSRTKVLGTFRSRGGKTNLLFSNKYDLLRCWTKDQISGIYSVKTRVQDRWCHYFDTIFSHDELPPTSLLYCVYGQDILNRHLFMNTGYFDCWVTLFPAVKGTSLFNAIGHFKKTTRMDHLVFVRSGWRIMARNLLTDEILELGFIDTDSIDRSLTAIKLPDGDYEIFVLTSSLFWNDCRDRNIRTISIRPDTESSPLPVIYNLRSSISQGATLIEWSANQMETDDCLFMIWYSPDNTIDVTRPPDETVWYVPSQTEYRTPFQQNAPCYVRIAAMRPGNEPEYGTIHQLFLDWNTTPPCVPNDVLVLNLPLPAVEPNIETSNQDDPDITLWQ
jgi:hypothetical protein